MVALFRVRKVTGRDDGQGMTEPVWVVLADQDQGGFVCLPKLTAEVMLDGKLRRVELRMARGTVQDVIPHEDCPCIDCHRDLGTVP